MPCKNPVLTSHDALSSCGLVLCTAPRASFKSSQRTWQRVQEKYRHKLLLLLLLSLMLLLLDLPTCASTACTRPVSHGGVCLWTGLNLVDHG